MTNRLAAHKLSVLCARFLTIAWYFWPSHSPAPGLTELFRCTGSAPLPATSLHPTRTRFARFFTHWVRSRRPRISWILFRNSGRCQAKDFEINCCTIERCTLTCMNIFSTCLTNLSQVELAKGAEKATCYPVDGPGDFGWCTVEQDVEEVRCLSSKNLPRLWKFDRIGASAATTATSRGFTTIPSWWKQGLIFSSQKSKIFDKISKSAQKTKSLWDSEI